MPGEATEKVTYCRVCEPLCGMVATVDRRRLTKVRPDPDHPLSAGFACPEGDRDERGAERPRPRPAPAAPPADGSFERVTWDVALDEIGERLGAIRDRHGGDAVGWYMGNPGAFSYSHPLWVEGLPRRARLAALLQRRPRRTSPTASPPASSSTAPRSSSRSPTSPAPSCLLIVGANPLVSHGSVLSAPRVKDQLHAITARGGRVVVVDPRRSETARAFEHLAIDPRRRRLVLLSMLEVIFDEGLEDAAALDAPGRAAPRACAGWSPEHPPEATEAAQRGRRRADVAPWPATSPPRRARRRLRAHRLLPGAKRHPGRLPARRAQRGHRQPRPRGRGDVRRPADRLQPASPTLAGLATYGKVRSRVGDLPEVLGSLPASVMAKEMTTPGPGQIRAMFVSAGNPVLSVPNGAELEAAIDELELSVAIDLYVTDTSRHCDFVLPATTMYEREDFPLPFLGLFTHPVHPDDRGGRRAARRGAAGVGDHRGHLEADRDRPLERPDRAHPRQRRDPSLAASGSSTCC